MKMTAAEKKALDDVGLFYTPEELAYIDKDKKYSNDREKEVWFIEGFRAAMALKKKAKKK